MYYLMAIMFVVYFVKVGKKNPELNEDGTEQKSNLFQDLVKGFKVTVNSFPATNGGNKLTEVNPDDESSFSRPGWCGERMPNEFMHDFTNQRQNFPTASIKQRRGSFVSGVLN